MNGLDLDGAESSFLKRGEQQREGSSVFWIGLIGQGHLTGNDRDFPLIRVRVLQSVQPPAVYENWECRKSGRPFDLFRWRLSRIGVGGASQQQQPVDSPSSKIAKNGAMTKRTEASRTVLYSSVALGGKR